MKTSESLLKKLGLMGISLCVACCALPPIGVMLGIGALAAAAKYLEWAGIAILLGMVLALLIRYRRRHKAPSCSVDCECKDQRNPIGPLGKGVGM